MGNIRRKDPFPIDFEEDEVSLDEEVALRWNGVIRIFIAFKGPFN